MLGTEEKDFLDCVEKGNLQMVKQYLTNGGNINARRNHLRDGALHIAGWRKNQEMLSMLIDAGADINMKNERDWTVLHCLTYRNSSVKMISLVLRHGVDVNAQDSLGCTALHYVRNAASCKELLSVPGVNLDLQMDDDGNTPVHEIFKYGNRKFVPLFAAAGANCNVINEYGKTVFEEAVQQGDVEIVKVFLAHGADVTVLTGPKYPTWDALFDCDHDHQQQMRSLLASHGIHEPILDGANKRKRKKARTAAPTTFQFETRVAYRTLPSSCAPDAYDFGKEEEAAEEVVEDIAVEDVKAEKDVDENIVL